MGTQILGALIPETFFLGAALNGMDGSGLHPSSLNKWNGMNSSRLNYSLLP